MGIVVDEIGDGAGGLVGGDALVPEDEDSLVGVVGNRREVLLICGAGAYPRTSGRGYAPSL
jgi:hypothetical protein